MALNIKNPEVEKLAAEAAALAGETKTEAIRQALQDRVAKLKMRGVNASREKRVRRLLEEARKEFPRGDFGRRMTKAEREEILGYGPEGV